MGREVKRVPLDFDWPIGKVWEGYINGKCSEFHSTAEYLGVDPCDLCRRYAQENGIGLTEFKCPDFDVHPPEGDGWQMWETISEGSPISPVFETPQELASWLVENKIPAGLGSTASYEQWLNMITKCGWSVTGAVFVGEGGGVENIISGVEMCSESERMS